MLKGKTWIYYFLEKYGYWNNSGQNKVTVGFFKHSSWKKNKNFLLKNNCIIRFVKALFKTYDVIVVLTFLSK